MIMNDENINVGRYIDMTNITIQYLITSCSDLQKQLDAMGDKMNKLQTHIDELERKIQW